MQSLSRLLITGLLVITSGWIVYKAINNTPEPQNTSVIADTKALFASQFLNVDGSTQPLNTWQGKIVLVNFWATWCPPCREEMPELSNIQDKFRENGVIVLGISVDDVAKTKAFIQEAPVSYPILVGDMQGMELSQGLGNINGILPYTVLLNTQGNIVKVYQGRISQSTVEQAIIALTSTKQNSAQSH